jgi:plasmid stabilization system protein ParE
VKRYRIARRAARDIEGICAWIARDDLDAALRVWSRFDAAFAKLERVPVLGHRRVDLADPRHGSGRSARTSSSTCSSTPA